LRTERSSWDIYIAVPSEECVQRGCKRIMDVSQQFNRLGVDAALDLDHDEELPGYEASTAPAYNSGFYDDGTITYHLRRFDRKIQTLVAYGPPRASSYRITTHSFRLFSKKPEMEVLYTSPEMRQRKMASIWFDNEGPLPWRPRAHIDYTGVEGTRTRLDMESTNFADWNVTMGNQRCEWKLEMLPVSLALVNKESRLVVARFTYSAHGATAARGAEAGELVIQRGCLEMHSGGIDQVVCSVMVALTQLQRLGRQYCNPGGEQWR
jgi:hypothetical protein